MFITDMQNLPRCHSYVRVDGWIPGIGELHGLIASVFHGPFDGFLRGIGG